MSEQPNNQQKEVDLFDVTGKIFSGIGKGIQILFGWTKRMIQFFFCLALKHWWTLLAVSILGGTFGYFKAKRIIPYFETEMLVETNVVSRIQIVDRINSLQRIIREGNNVSLAEYLSLPIDEINAIFFIKANAVGIAVDGRTTKTVVRRDENGKVIEEIITEINPQFVRIQVHSRKNAVINQLAESIVSFIENDPFTAKQTELASRMSLSQQEAIELEIQQLTLFQRKNLEKKSLVAASGNIPFMVVNEEKTYSHEIMEFKNQLAFLQREHEILHPALVVRPFTPFKKSADKRMKNILNFALLFFAVGYGILLFRESKKDS